MCLPTFQAWESAEPGREWFAMGPGWSFRPGSKLSWVGPGLGGFYRTDLSAVPRLLALSSSGNTRL